MVGREESVTQRGDELTKVSEGIITQINPIVDAIKLACYNIGTKVEMRLGGGT
jgi:hypothetical protein